MGTGTLSERKTWLLAQKAKLTTTKPSGYGDVAPLDNQGFHDVSIMCCPVEMERLFDRLLEADGQNVCSKPHVQGLMHWFSCQPEMDVQYVLDVIANGNPCKYWAPKEQACPTLSPECAGHWCDGGASQTADPTPAPAPAPTEEVVAEAPVAITEAPVLVTEAPVTERAPTEGPEELVIPTEAPTTEGPPEAPEEVSLPDVSALLRRPAFAQ